MIVGNLLCIHTYIYILYMCMIMCVYSVYMNRLRGLESCDTELYMYVLCVCEFRYSAEVGGLPDRTGSLQWLRLHHLPLRSVLHTLYIYIMFRLSRNLRIL